MAGRARRRNGCLGVCDGGISEVERKLNQGYRMKHGSLVAGVHSWLHVRDGHDVGCNPFVAHVTIYIRHVRSEHLHGEMRLRSHEMTHQSPK